VRELDLQTGELSTIAGTGSSGFSGDGGLAVDARLTRPHVAVRVRNGDLIIGDSFNHRIRRIDQKTTGDLLFTEWATGRVLRLGFQDHRLHILVDSDTAQRGEGRAAPVISRAGPLGALALDAEGRIVAAAPETGLVVRIDLRRHTVSTIIGGEPGIR